MPKSKQMKGRDALIATLEGRPIRTDEIRQDTRSGELALVAMEMGSDLTLSGEIALLDEMARWTLRQLRLCGTIGTGMCLRRTVRAHPS